MNYVTMERSSEPDATASDASGRIHGCIFRDKPRQRHDAENLILFRGALAYVLMNLYPYDNGHLMIAPYEHAADFVRLDPAALSEIMEPAQRAQSALGLTYRPDGYNLGMNIGSAAGAGIAAHPHLRIVPRRNGDTNFMRYSAIPKSCPTRRRAATKRSWRTGAEGKPSQPREN